MYLNFLQHDAHKIAKDHGFWRGFDGGDNQSRANTVLAKLMLIVTEAAEAAEDVREMTAGGVEADGKPIGFGSELADIVIRVADLAEAVGIDLEAVVEAKMGYNVTRPYMHGGKTA